MTKIINNTGMLINLPQTPVSRPKIEIPDSRFAKPKNKISKSQRAELRLKFGGRCAYCGCELPEKGWHADHVEPVRRDFEFVRAPAGSGATHVTRSNGKVRHPDLHAIENLFPACAPCNLFKSSFSVEQMRNEISKQIERAQAYSVNFRTARRFGLVDIVNKPVTFWFEQYKPE
jgi:hypothetical protein